MKAPGAAPPTPAGGSRETGGGALRSNTVDLTWTPRSREENDLGDIILGAVTPLFDEVQWVSGRVVDTGGKAVIGATVHLAPVSNIGSTLAGHALQAESDHAGYFLVAGPLVHRRLAMRVTAPGFVGSAHDYVALGATDVRIELHRAGR